MTDVGVARNAPPCLALDIGATKVEAAIVDVDGTVRARSRINDADHHDDLITAVIDSQVVTGFASPFAARNLLVCVMIVLTLIGMFAISTRMLVLRNDMVFIDNVPQDDARRVEFNRLHIWSTRLEGAVLILGLAVIFLTSRRLA